ncbi:MAG: diketogulonate reductase-like aldo/keto reductase, partial [Bacillariaceae sp.]|jgi:diketogulonate reductase-like aldo/keto reductase
VRDNDKRDIEGRKKKIRKMMRMKYSFLLSWFIVAIDRPCYCKSEGFFGKIIRLATGGEDSSAKDMDMLQLGGVPVAKLSNGVEIPLIGLGVGNMQAEVVTAIISHGLKEDKNIRLIDTSNISNNEFLVAKGITEGVEGLITSTTSTTTITNSSKVEVHVITKIWYTHLGYNRTLLSVKSSLDSLQEAIDHPNIDLKVHMILHWPRCYDEIPWMECEAEENNLSEEIKNAGPPPHLNKQDAWKESWKALESLVVDDSNPIASIGVSNFHLNELEELLTIATIAPHVVETNTWSLLYDPLLIEFCHKRGIHLIAHQLIEGVIGKADSAPFAYHHLLSIANDMTNKMRKDDNDIEELTAAQVVLSWLVQHSISVIPRTTDLYHLKENSASSLSKIPSMDDSQVQIVAHSVEALISGEDLTEDAFVKLTFHAKSKDIYLYWHDPEFGGEIEVAKIEKGKSFEESSHPGHVFRIYSGTAADDSSESKGGDMELFTVSGKYGEHRHIEL